MAVAIKRIRKPEVPKSGNPHQLLPRNGGFLTASDTGSPKQLNSFFQDVTHTHIQYIYMYIIYIQYIVLKSCLINSSPEFQLVRVSLQFSQYLSLSIDSPWLQQQQQQTFAVSSTMTGLFPPSLRQLCLSTLITKKPTGGPHLHAQRHVQYGRCTYHILQIHTQSHTHICIYIHIYIYLCV